jgi:hypothetical protein
MMMMINISFQGKGKLLFFNRQLEQVYQVAVSDAVSLQNTPLIILLVMHLLSTTLRFFSRSLPSRV